MTTHTVHIVHLTIACASTP